MITNYTIRPVNTTNDRITVFILYITKLNFNLIIRPLELIQTKPRRYNLVMETSFIQLKIEEKEITGLQAESRSAYYGKLIESWSTEYSNG